MLLEPLLKGLALASQQLGVSIHFFERLLWCEGVLLPCDAIHQHEADRLIEHVLPLSASADL